MKRLRDPRALRALAHPTRLSLSRAAPGEGPLTATRAGGPARRELGQLSFHLRQLAKYGLVEGAGGGTGRERPWRATAMFTDRPEVAEDPELAVAADLLASVLAERYFEDLMRWLEARPGEPEAWQRAAHFGDTFLYITPGELVELGEQAQAGGPLHGPAGPPGTAAAGGTPGHLSAPGLPLRHLSFGRKQAAGRSAR